MSRNLTIHAELILAIALTNVSSMAQQEHAAHIGPERQDALGAMRPGRSGGWYASGTSQVPFAIPAQMLHRPIGAWSVMMQGTIFGAWTNQTGPRGRDKLFATNWFMPMASRRVGPGLLTVRSMFSLDPLTVTEKRYPLMFQTGELANGIPIIDGQHPHDFLMELGVAYQVPIGERLAVNVFAGPRGEPTLGPPAYPHRPSASENPTAPISHHYQDSTHISSTVLAAGITYGPATLEASGFHGREPDEHRWGLEQGSIDSFAARATLTPTPQWALQFSMGRINNREQLHANRDTLRTSASISYGRNFSNGHWISSLIWGRNHDLEFSVQSQSACVHGAVSFRRCYGEIRFPGYIYNSFLAESTVLLGQKHWLWGRAENTDRDSLLLYKEAPFVVFVHEQRYTRVQVYTVGYEYELPKTIGTLSTGLGAQMMIYGVPDNLRLIYGPRPVGVQAFLRIRLTSSGL